MELVLTEVPDTVDDALDALSSPSTDEVFDATRAFSSREIGSSAVSRAGGGGGSQVFKDLGTVSANDLATGGPQTLYTLAAGEIVVIGFSALTYCDTDKLVVFGRLSDLLAVSGNNSAVHSTALSFFDTDLFEGALFAPRAAIDSPQALPSLTRLLTAGPLAAAWVTYGAEVVGTAPGTWQATHAYALGAWLVDSNDHLQHCTTAGTSGGSQPTWDMAGSTTADGTAVWTDEGPVPTVGSATVVALAGVPA